MPPTTCSTARRARSATPSTTCLAIGPTSTPPARRRLTDRDHKAIPMTSTTASPSSGSLKGGEWLIRTSRPGDVFTPERLTDEHRLIAQTVAQFVDQEVLPQLERLDQKDWSFARHLIKRCADLGLLGIDVAEADGGLQLDKVT